MAPLLNHPSRVSSWSRLTPNRALNFLLHWSLSWRLISDNPTLAWKPTPALASTLTNFKFGDKGLVVEKQDSWPLSAIQLKNEKQHLAAHFLFKSPSIDSSTILETPILWPPDTNNWLIWKDADAGKDWGQEEKGTTEDEMVGWHHWLNRHEFE